MQGRTDFWLFGTPISHSVAPAIQNFLFDSAGLHTHRYKLFDTGDLEKSKFAEELRKPAFGGCAVTMPNKTVAVKYMDKLTPSAQAVGSINTVFLEFPSGRDDGQPVFVGHNTDVEGVRNALLRSLHLDNPDPKRPLPQRTDEKRPVFAPGSAYSFIIGGGGTTRAAVHALDTMGVSPIFLINRDPAETKAVVDHFPHLDLIPLSDEATTREQLQKQSDAGKRLCVGVGAIPAIDPVTDAEKMVYTIAKMILSQPDLKKEGDLNGRHFLEMPYKPRWTPMMQIAQDRGWKAISGVEAVVEQGLAQQYLWQHKKSFGEAEVKVRDYLDTVTGTPPTAVAA